MVLRRFHRRSLRLVPALVGACVMLSLGGCDKGSSSQAGKTSEASDGTDRVTPEALPSPPPPPPVDGAVFDRGVYVQTCGDPPCPDLLQEAGATHCEALALGDRSWRLPSDEEAARFGSLELEQTSGYHWTGTAFAQDDAQVWIVDPASDQPTTVPKDRKPFRVRCVSDREPTPGPNAAE